MNRKRPAVALFLAILLGAAGPAAGENPAGGTGGDAADEWVRAGTALMQRCRETASHDFSEARAAFERAVALDAASIDAQLGMAWVSNSEHDFEAGERWAGMVLERDPGHPRAHALLGDRAMELGDYDAATHHLQQALDQAPGLSTFSRAGHLLWVTGDLDGARDLMKRAIAAGGPHPENAAWCRAELSRMECKVGRLDEAEHLARRAVADAPGNPRTLLALAEVQAARKMYREAAASCERSVAQGPTHEAIALLTDLLALLGRSEEAELQFRMVLAFHRLPHGHGAAGKGMHQHGGTGNVQLARFLADHGTEAEEALREARRAHEVAPNVQGADTLAWCLLLNDRPEEAEEMMAQALQWETADPILHYHAGLIAARLGKREEARSRLVRALAMNPEFDPRQAPRARAALEALPAEE